MSIFKAALLKASRSPWLADQFRKRRFARRAVRRFMPGEDMDAAVDAAESFSGVGMGTVVTNLGEQVRSPAEALAVREHYLELLNAAHHRSLPTQISVKLTHLGLELDADDCMESVRVLLERAAETDSFVWIDMEESWYVDRTLDIFRHARQGSDRVGVCLQAYLRRTPEDLESLLPLGPSIRLVKGAYREAPEVAFPKKQETDAAFFELGERLLRNAAHGTLPVFGTHDFRTIDRLAQSAQASGLVQGDWEVHMLYGIRTAAQRKLADSGVRVRVLVSYGENWFPWYVRRLAERPANLWFVVKSVFS
jgi:proline dehydrogenase